MSKTPLHFLDKIDIHKFQTELIHWFENEQRDLPWRRDKDPYKVWVSEIMLQQTRVDTVIPYFNRFMEKFPSIQALAKAEEEEVLKAWEGLGYYSRARNLQTAVREVHENYNGKVPDNQKEISSLKGVGPYTAGAILSIAYSKPEPAVDGNVMRVLSRILMIFEDIAKPATRKIFEEAVRKLISHQNPSYFNQALMELGALICTPTSPSCLLCPVNEHCQAFQNGEQQSLPVKTKNKKQKKVQLAAIVLKNQKGQILIHKRPATGLLANLWEFPNIEIHLPFINEKDQLKNKVKTDFGADIQLNEMELQIEHVFSHLIWNIRVYTGELIQLSKETSHLKLVTKEEIERFPFSVSHQKILKAFIQDNE
ncbi:A/G-specific adenine glycosylase [Bacillus sp. 03113]|uniref:A/G-specific adenine glycosylase n=1 Tax=Bacillus sp. 03113 TaxID=2578211 RepID=UPI0011419201|nr:A/G-specific adenine glycosylase [Bacillus sp. 03113]